MLTASRLVCVCALDELSLSLHDCTPREVCRLKKAKQRADIKRTVNKMNEANAIKSDQTNTDQPTPDTK